MDPQRFDAVVVEEEARRRPIDDDDDDDDDEEDDVPRLIPHPTSMRRILRKRPPAFGAMLPPAR